MICLRGRNNIPSRFSKWWMNLWENQQLIFSKAQWFKKHFAVVVLARVSNLSWFMKIRGTPATALYLAKEPGAERPQQSRPSLANHFGFSQNALASVPKACCCARMQLKSPNFCVMKNQIPSWDITPIIMVIQCYIPTTWNCTSKWGCVGWPTKNHPPDWSSAFWMTDILMGQSLVSNQNLICDIWLAAPSSLPIDSFTTFFGGLSEIRAAKKKNAVNLKNGQNQIPRFGCLNQNVPNVSNRNHPHCQVERIQLSFS